MMDRPVDLAALAAGLETVRQPSAWLLLDTQYREPSKPRDGMFLIADGVEWNPTGAGGGPHVRFGGAWVKVG